MTKKKAPQQPLTGDAAWIAAKDEIARRNDEAHARSAVRRAAQEARLAERRRTSASRPAKPRP
jgi:hypothetical protein